VEGHAAHDGSVAAVITEVDAADDRSVAFIVSASSSIR
jgi:hypothetical protein